MSESGLQRQKAPPSESAQVPRRFPRRRAVIPVRAALIHAWQVSFGRAFAGSLLNVSRSGAALRLRGVSLPPRTRLQIWLPGATIASRLAAEVVWTSLLPGESSDRAIYGLRWVEELSQVCLDSLGDILGPERA
ncbi:MAG: PilZ domain-containing protein [candidate division NC10 bacterium]|nr:PilZ domain-containing protein [candidate division NC10 bacterium]